MSSYSSDGSRSGHRSPLFGTATFSTLTPSESAQTRYSYSSRSGISSDDSDISGNDMRRITVSPSPTDRHSRSDLRSWSEDDSSRDDAEVEAALSALDNELEQTEDALTEWSRQSSATPSSYLSGSASSPSLTSTSSIYIPFTNTLRDARILSTITERTENPSSRPTSYNLSVPGSRPVSDAIRRSAVSLHSRGVTEPGPSTGTPSRRTGDLIAFFEDKSSSSDNSSRSYSPYGHRRTGSVPAGPRSPSPYTQTSQSVPTFTTTYGYGSSNSRPSSPSKSWSSQSRSYTSTPPRSFLSPPPHSNTTRTDSRLESPYMSSETPTYSNTFTPTSYSFTNTSTTTQGTSLRRPQTSPRSPLSSVRNVVAAWKSRSPSIDKSSQVSATDTTPEEGFFSIRRRAERGFQRERASIGGESGPSTFRRSGLFHQEVPSTPETSTSLTPSGIVSPAFDLTELGTFAEGSEEPLRIGLLWYLNVHVPHPYRWQRCQAVLYPNMLLLSWIAQGGGRGVVTLDLLNCTEVRSVASPTHRSAQDDVGTIAARAQTANAQAEGFGELGLLETLCPFQLFYGDGVERLGAESARERVRWVSAIWEVLDRSVTVPDRSETQSPTGSMRTIRSMASTSTHSSSAVSGSRSTTFLPPVESIPDLSDFQSLSGSSVGSLSRQPSLRSRAADDAAISNQTIVYPGDPRVIAPSRSSSLRRTTSMTDLGEEFESALRRAKDARPGLGFGLGLAGAIIGEGSPVTVSSGPTLGRDVIVTPPPSASRAGGSRVRAMGSESVASVSDDAFFSSGARTTGEQSPFHSLSSVTDVTTPAIDSTSAVLTEETSGSGTVVPPTYRTGPSEARPSTSTDLPSRPIGLTRSRAVRTRRDAASSISYSASSLSGMESSSDKDNTSNHDLSRSYSEFSRSDEFSTLESYSRSTHTRSANGTPLPSSSSERSPRSEGESSPTETPTSSTPFETARSPSVRSSSIISFASLPSIPSLYETAVVCSSESEATKSVSVNSKASPKVESGSEYITAPVCESEPASPFVTAEVCPTEASTEYEDAECRCKPEKVVVSEGIQAAVPEPIEQVVPQPVERAITEPVEDVVPAPVEEDVHAAPLPRAGEAISIPIPEPVVAVEPIAGPRITEIPREFPLYPPSSPTASSPLGTTLTLSTTSISNARRIALPESVVSSESSVIVRSVPPPLPEPSPIHSPESLPTTSLLTSVTESTPSTLTPPPPSPSIHGSRWAPETDDTYESSILAASPSVQSISFPEPQDISFDTSILRPTASAYTSQEPSRLSTIDESQSTQSPSFISSSSSSPSPTPTAIVSVSVTASSPSLPVPVRSPLLQVPSSTTVVTPSLSSRATSVALTRTPSSVSTSSIMTDILEGSVSDLEEVSTEPSLLSTQISRAISPAYVPLPRSPSMPTASASVSISSPRGSIPSIRSDLMTIPSERPPSERPSSERPSVIITDDINRLLQYLHGLEGDRQRDNQGIHDHLGEIQNELRGLADYIHDKEALPPVQFKDQSVGEKSVISRLSPREAPPPILPTVTGKASPRLVPIPLTPPPHSPRSPSSLSSSISFLSSYHSDDLSLMESEPFSEKLPSLSSTPISSSPTSSSLQSSPSSSPSSRTLPLTPISQSPPSSGEYLSRTSTEITQRPPPTSVSPTQSVVSSATVRPRAPGIDREALNRIREVLDGVKAQTDDLRDGQLWTTNVLDELRQRSPPDNTELVERLQRLEDLINRLAEAPRHPRAPTPVESLFDSGSDISSTIRRLRARWEGMRDEPQTLIAPTPVRPPTSLDDMMAELLRPPQPPAPPQIQPPPAFIPLTFRPDARGLRPRSASPTLLTEALPMRPYTVPLAEPFITTRDLGRRRPSRAGRLPRPTALAPTPLHPPETLVTHDVGRRIRPDETGPGFLDELHQLRRRRPTAPPDGWIHSRQDGAEPAPPPPPPHDQQDAGRATAPAVMETRPWYPQPPPGPSAPGAMPQLAQPGVVPPMPPPFTQSVILPPIFNDMMAMVRENRFMHLASLEQQRELMRYMNSLNEWLGHDVEDRQSELRGVAARLDQLRDDLNRLGLTRGPFPPPGPGVEPGGFIMPPGPPGGPGAHGVPGRPGTAPGGHFVPPPPQVSFPQPSQQYSQQYPMMPPVRPYRTPTPTESPVFPSPPSRDGGAPFIPPDLGPARGSIAVPPQGIYQPPIPGVDDEIYIPPEPSYLTSSPSIGSPRSTLAPVLVPPPGPQQPPPPIFVHPPSHSQLGRTPSPPRSRSPTPPAIPGQPTIIVPPQPGAAPPAVPWAPSTQRLHDERPDQHILLPPGQPPFQLVASPRPGHTPSDFDGRREGQPIIIHPPPQSHITPGSYGPPGPGIIIPPSHPRTRSTTPTTSSPRSPRPSVIAGPYPPTMFPGGAPFPGALPGAPFPGAPFPGAGAPFPVPMPGVGMGIPPTAAPPIAIVTPSRGSRFSPEPEYRSPRESPRPYPESRAPYPESRAPSRAPSRYAEGPYPEGPYQPPPPVPIPTAIHHIEHDPYRPRRGERSRTPPSRTPSIGPEERERGDRRPYRTPSPEYRDRPEYPVPIGVGPGYDRGAVPTVIHPPSVTHVHQYPSTYPPRSPTGSSPPFTEREGEPLPHPFGAPTQYPPTEQAPMPIGRTPTRPSRAPTIVEVTGPEPIQVYPPPDHRRPRTESAPYQPPISGHVSERPISPSFESQVRGASPSVPFVPMLPSDASRRTYPPRQPGYPEPGTYGHIPLESLTEPEEYEPPIEDPRGVPGVHRPGEEPRGVPGVHRPGEEPRGAPGEEPRGAPGEKPRGAPGEEPRGAPGEEPRGAPGEEPRGALGEEPRGAPGEEPRGAPRGADISGIPEPETHGHIPPGSLTPSEEYGEESRDAPVPGLPVPGVSRAPTARGAPGPGAYAHIPPGSVTEPSEPYGEARGAPLPGVSRAATARGPGITPRYPSGPGALDYDDAEQARQERFGDLERQMVDAAQDAAESEMRRDHQFAEKQAERDRQFEDSEARRDATFARHPVPPGAPASSPKDMLELPPEGAEAVVASIRRASTESAARHADDIRDIVHGEREEMARQLQAEREEARAAREALEQQVLAGRARADEERDARMRELEEELARVRAELDHEKQQRDQDEEMRRESESQRNLERDEETRQQLSEITDLLLAHREEFARKKETVDERWREKLEWRDETNRQFHDLFGMVQGVIDSCAEAKEKCEEERRLAEQRPSTQDVMNELQRLQQVFDSLTASWHEETERQHADLLETVRSTANVQVPFNVQGYLDEFSKSLATEVRMLLNEVSKLREERRNIQFEIGTLLCWRSKYETGGMFDPDWKPPSTGLAPQPPPGDLPPDQPPMPPSEPRQGAWRSVHQRGGFRRRKKPEAPPAGPVIETTPTAAAPPDRAGSWATWQVQPGVEYTPPPSEPTIHLVPEAPPPRGLFGPRSPRTSPQTPHD